MDPVEVDGAGEEGGAPAVGGAEAGAGEGVGVAGAVAVGACAGGGGAATAAAGGDPTAGAAAGGLGTGAVAGAGDGEGAAAGGGEALGVEGTGLGRLGVADCAGTVTVDPPAASACALLCSSLPPLFLPPNTTPSVMPPATSRSTTPAAAYTTHSFLGDFTSCLCHGTPMAAGENRRRRGWYEVGKEARNERTGASQNASRGLATSDVARR